MSPLLDSVLSVRIQPCLQGPMTECDTYSSLPQHRINFSRTRFMILAPEVPNICASIQRMYYKLLMIILMVEVFYFKRNANVLYLNFALKIPILNLIVRLS